MTDYVAQEKAIADLMGKMDTPSVSRPERVSGAPSTRRTRIVPDAPAEGYAVTIGPATIEVMAPTPGVAVLRAAAAAKAAGIADAGARVFMWEYAVCDSQGSVLAGADPAMRASLEDALINRRRYAGQ